MTVNIRNTEVLINGLRFEFPGHNVGALYDPPKNSYFLQVSTPRGSVGEWIDDPFENFDFAVRVLRKKLKEL